jgi:uncharacterized repeat protein (TIGR01451 family)
LKATVLLLQKPPLSNSHKYRSSNKSLKEKTNMHRPRLRLFSARAPRIGWSVLAYMLAFLLPVVSSWQLSPPAARADPAAETVTLTVTDGYDSKLRKRLSQDGKVYTVQASDDDYWETDAGYFTVFQFQPDIPGEANLHAVRLFIQHHEEKDMKKDSLSWQVGAGELQNPTVLASQRAQVLAGEGKEQRVEWDVTRWINTPALVNDLKFVIYNEDRKGKKTRLNHLFMRVVYSTGQDPTATNTATATQTATETPEPTATLIPTAIDTAIATATATNSPTLTPTPTASATPTTTPTDALQPTATSTEPPEPAPPDDPTATATMTPESDQPPAPTVTPSPDMPPAAADLTITKSDFLFDDVDGDDVVSPGDILFYEIKIVNSGASGASALRLEDQPDANSPLIPGTVQAIGGVVVTGNGADDGQVVVTIESLAVGASAVVSFRVRVEPMLGVSHVQNQAWVNFVDEAGEPTGLAPLASDDPATATPNDPTVTPLGAAGATLESIFFLPLIQRN